MIRVLSVVYLLVSFFTPAALTEQAYVCYPQYTASVETSQYPNSNTENPDTEVQFEEAMPIAANQNELNGQATNQNEVNGQVTNQNEVNGHSQTTSENNSFAYGKSFSVKIRNKEFILENRKAECEEKNGVYVGVQCFRRSYMPDHFLNARKFCLLEDGDLWIPDFKDPNLYELLAGQFSEIFSTKRVYVGVVHNGNSFLTLDSFKDVSDSYLAKSAIIIKEDTENEDYGSENDETTPTSETSPPRTTTTTEASDFPFEGRKRRRSWRTWERTGQIPKSLKCVSMSFVRGLALYVGNCSTELDFACEFKMKSKDEKIIKKVFTYY